MNWLVRFALNRAREASTWRGLILLFAGSWATAHPEQAEAVIAMAIALAGAIGAFFPDAKPKPDLPPIELQSRPATTEQLHHAALPSRTQAPSRSVADADAAISTRPADGPGWNG